MYSLHAICSISVEAIYELLDSPLDKVLSILSAQKNHPLQDRLLNTPIPLQDNIEDHRTRWEALYWDHILDYLGVLSEYSVSEWIETRAVGSPSEDSISENELIDLFEGSFGLDRLGALSLKTCCTMQYKKSPTINSVLNCIQRVKDALFAARLSDLSDIDHFGQSWKSMPQEILEDYMGELMGARLAARFRFSDEIEILAMIEEASMRLLKNISAYNPTIATLATFASSMARYTRPEKKSKRKQRDDVEDIAALNLPPSFYEKLLYYTFQTDRMSHQYAAFCFIKLLPLKPREVWEDYGYPPRRSVNMDELASRFGSVYGTRAMIKPEIMQTLCQPWQSINQTQIPFAFDEKRRKVGSTLFAHYYKEYCHRFHARNEKVEESDCNPNTPEGKLVNWWYSVSQALARIMGTDPNNPLPEYF